MWWRISTIVILGLLSGCVIAGVVFVYNYMFRTLDSVQSLQSLNAEVSVNKLDSDSFNQAMKLVALKNDPISIPNNLRNIFSYSSSTASTALSPVSSTPVVSPTSSLLTTSSTPSSSPSTSYGGR